MTIGASDDDLRRRVQELGRHEGAAAPDFRRVLQGPPRAADPRRTARWRPAVALAAAALIVAFAAWWPTPPSPVPAPSGMAGLGGDPDEVWVLPSDRLLADARDLTAAGDVERLSREIEGLLRP